MASADRTPAGPLAAHPALETSRDNPLTPAQRRQRQEAAFRHGLYAAAGTAVGRRRSKMVGALLARLLEVLAEQGRPLREEQIPHARRWAEAHLAASTAFRVWLGEPTTNAKAFDQWRQAANVQAQFAKDLGLTPATAAVAGGDDADLVLSLALSARDGRNARQAMPEPLDGSARHSEALVASEDTNAGPEAGAMEHTGGYDND